MPPARVVTIGVYGFTVDRFLEARIDREQSAVIQQGRATLVRPYPISVEWPIHWLDKLPAPAECRHA